MRETKIESEKKVLIEAHKMRADDVVKKLESDSIKGLTAEEVKKSRQKNGENVLTKAKKKSLFKKIIEGITEPMMIILLIAFSITLAVNFIKITRGEAFDYIECIGILVAIILSVSITIFMEGRSAKAFDALNKFSDKILIKTIRNGSLAMVPQNELVVGDIIKLEVGDKIPVDSRLISSFGLELDESPLTGESNPVNKKFDFVFVCEKTPLAERINMVYGGCFVTAGSGSAVIVAVGDNTEIGSIAKELSVSESALTPLQHKLDKLGKRIAILGGIAAAVVFIIQLITLFVKSNVSFDSVQEIFVTSIVLIVASVPEGLPTIVAVSLALNVIKMAKQNALVKKMVACETVGSISVICSDKTGTLTENKMTVSDICTARGTIEPDKLTDPFIIKNFCINTTANLILNEDKIYSFIGSPTECAMLVAYNKTNPKVSYSEVRDSAKVVYTYNFSSELKRMTTVLLESGQNIAYTKGAPEIVLDMCEIDAGIKKRLLAQIGSFQEDAKRVIALAHGTVKSQNFAIDRAKIEKGLIFDGFVVIADPIRKDVYAAVKQCHRAGVEVKMLTGDNIITARAIARELKIISDDSQVLHAEQIENMSDEELVKCIANIKVVARSTPMTKLRIVKMLKSCGAVVAVTGDGINDAPAIHNADVGIAMGITGTEVSKEAADIVLLDDSFSTIVTSLEWGRGIYENFQRFIMFQLTVNLCAVLVTIVCILLGMDAPFNALQLLWINLIMDGPPALTLGLEPMHNDLMDRKPISRDSSIVTKNMVGKILANGVFMATVLICQSIFNFLGVRTDKEKTVMFTMFVIFQLFNSFNARELGEANILKNLTKNKAMLIIMIVTFALQVVITQCGTAVFNTIALSRLEWLKVIAMAFSIIVFNEVYKVAIKKFKRVRNGKIIQRSKLKRTLSRI